MKKILLAALSLVTVICLNSCDSDNSNSTNLTIGGNSSLGTDDSPSPLSLNGLLVRSTNTESTNPIYIGNVTEVTFSESTASWRPVALNPALGDDFSPYTSNYEWVKTGESTGTVTFKFDEDITEIVTYTYLNPTSGTFEFNHVDGSITKGSFTANELPDGQ